MAIEKKELDYAKEVGDVGVLLAELVEDLRAKKPAETVLAENIQNLVAAIDKVDQVDDEMKANRKAALATIGYHTGELTDAIIGNKQA